MAKYIRSDTWFRLVSIFALALIHQACPAGGSFNQATTGSADSPSVAQTTSTTMPVANPNTTTTDPNAALISTDGDGEFVIGPNYSNGPEWAGADANHTGTLQSFTLNSQDSNYYNGLDATLNSPGSFTRQGWVYTPAGYVAGTEIALMVVQDGGNYTGLTKVLDYLIAQHMIPTMVVIFINPGPGDSFGSERGLEYDTVSAKYGEFVQDEIIPYVRDTYQLNLTEDPNARAVMGGSSGGAAAFTMAWYHPELYARVLSYSGTFVHQHTDSTYPHGAWTYHESLLIDAPTKNLRVALQVSQNDLNLDSENDGMHSWTVANGRMAACLHAKGYHYRYYYALNAGHTDNNVLNQTFGEAMTWLWRGAPSL